MDPYKPEFVTVFGMLAVQEMEVVFVSFDIGIGALRESELTKNVSSVSVV